MKRLVVAVLFPYFAPIMILAIGGFAYMAATPYKPSDGTGPAGSDVLGLYFIGLCFGLGSAMQFVLGVPLYFLVSQVKSFRLRLIGCLLAALIPVGLFIPAMIDTRSTAIEATFALAIVVVTFGGGCWVVFSQVTPDE